jgi:hypothetical protein
MAFHGREKFIELLIHFLRDVSPNKQAKLTRFSPVAAWAIFSRAAKKEKYTALKILTLNLQRSTRNSKTFCVNCEDKSAHRLTSPTGDRGAVFAGNF